MAAAWPPRLMTQTPFKLKKEVTKMKRKRNIAQLTLMRRKFHKPEILARNHI